MKKEVKAKIGFQATPEVKSKRFKNPDKTFPKVLSDKSGNDSDADHTEPGTKVKILKRELKPDSTGRDTHTDHTHTETFKETNTE